MQTMIHVKQLKKTFGQEHALKGIDFDIKEGSIFGLLGPSGSGKTTTIKLLIGELAPTDGEIEVMGFNHHQFNQSTYASKLGILSDKSSLYERLTVSDNLEMFRKLYGADKHAVDEVLEAVGLISEKKKVVSKLSKGMKQRILLCKAVLHRPRVLLLDEPTSALDPTTTERIHDKLLKLRAEGSTILLTTHNMAEATALCDQVAFLNEGRIQAMGTPSELRHRYKQNIVHLTYANGLVKKVVRNEVNLPDIQSAFLDDQIIDIHTDYPDLGEVFKKVTGKDLN